MRFESSIISIDVEGETFSSLLGNRDKPLVDYKADMVIDGTNDELMMIRAAIDEAIARGSSRVVVSGVVLTLIGWNSDPKPIGVRGFYEFRLDDV